MAFLKDVQDKIVLGRWRFLNLLPLTSSNTQSIGVDENGILGIIEDGDGEGITIEDVEGLQEALDEKADESDIPDVSGFATTTELTNGLAGKANTSHTHTISQVTGLQDELDGKADESDIPDISGLVTQTELTNGLQTKQDVGDYATNNDLTTGLGGKADTVHTHTQSQITGLVDDLAAKLTASKAAAVNDAVDETDIVAQFNELLANLRSAGIITV